MVWDTDDAKMLLDIPFPMNYVLIEQLSLNLGDVCLDNTLQMLCKSLLCFAKFGKIDYTQILKKLACKIFNFKVVYLAQFSTDSRDHVGRLSTLKYRQNWRVKFSTLK